MVYKQLYAINSNIAAWIIPLNRRVAKTENLTEIKFLRCTGSNWFVVEIDGCKGCAGSTYDFNDSRKFSWVTPRETHQVKYRDQTYIRGDLAVDKVCLSGKRGSGNCG